jgi:hypothetical protein
MAVTRWIYTDHFRVQASGLENIRDGAHRAQSRGQIPIDGFLVGMLLLLEAKPARVVRGMVEMGFGPPLRAFSPLRQIVGDVRMGRC